MQFYSDFDWVYKGSSYQSFSVKMFNKKCVVKRETVEATPGLQEPLEVAQASQIASENDKSISELKTVQKPQIVSEDDKSISELEKAKEMKSFRETEQNMLKTDVQVKNDEISQENESISDREEIKNTKIKTEPPSLIFQNPPKAINIPEKTTFKTDNPEKHISENNIIEKMEVDVKSTDTKVENATHPFGCRLWSPCFEHNGLGFIICRDCKARIIRNSNQVELLPNGDAHISFDLCPECVKPVLSNKINCV